MEDKGLGCQRPHQKFKYGMRVRTKANGNVHVTIVMDPITGEAFLTMHDAEVKKLECTARRQWADDQRRRQSGQRKPHR